jgi:2-polyprenyl-3-methyl-5-hydroxy-6-metoxy-1,4-benzoquinol methylase
MNNFFENIEKIDGIWRVLDKRETVSYPKDGSDNFVKIEESSFWFRHRNNCVKSIVNLFKDDEILFDVGGGNGFVSWAIKEAGVEPVIIEPDIRGILNAKKRGFENLINASFQDLNIVNETIPSIGMFDVLEHVENDKEFLNSINNALKIKGKLFLTVPAYNFLWSNEDRHDGHFRRYTDRRMTKLLKESNFKVLYSTYIFSLLPIPIFLLRSIPSLFNKKKKVFEKEAKEHSTGVLGKFFNLFFNKELKLLAQKRKIIFGGTLLIVAEKR